MNNILTLHTELATAAKEVNDLGKSPVIGDSTSELLQNGVKRLNKLYTDKLKIVDLYNKTLTLFKSEIEKVKETKNKINNEVSVLSEKIMKMEEEIAPLLLKTNNPIELHKFIETLTNTCTTLFERLKKDDLKDSS